MARDRAVHPDCPNASNPFHVCTENCAHGSSRSKKPVVKEVPAFNGVGSQQENKAKAGGLKRSVNPLCVNASNPFHQCADYCAGRNHVGKLPSNGVKLDGGTKEKVQIAGRGSLKPEKTAITDKRNVNPNCPNASNPFHQCAEYCSRTSAGKFNQSSSAGSSRGRKSVSERKEVNPACVNASNPFHKCSEYCSQARRINGVV